MSNINDKIRQIAKETEPELIHIRRELHQYPELGIDLPKTHEIISRELHKIPGLKDKRTCCRWVWSDRRT